MRWLPLAAALALAGCAHRPLAPSPHYVVGPAYEAGGVWRYPREEFRYNATGLAERLPDRRGLTADGEAFDPAAMAGAHRTLQLPAIATVANLENGRQARIRLNDRGPTNPGRILGLTRRAADLLGVPATGAAQVRVQVDSAASQALRDRLQGAPKGITAAPRGAVTAENLPPPEDAASPARPRVAAPRPVPEATGSPDADVPDRLPEVVQQETPQPGQLWIRAGQFSQAMYANRIKAKLSGLPVEVRRESLPRSPSFVVLAGPFASVAAADAALDQARAAGVTDAMIVVE
jgi:rare lipoprotein A